MAANISLHQPRLDYARPEQDEANDPGDNAESNAAPERQTPAQSQPSVSGLREQQGQSSGDDAGGSTHSHESAVPLPALPPTEEAIPIPLPAQFRYGLGEVSIGRPDYERAYADRVLPDQPERSRGGGEGSESELSPHITALVPPPQAANTPASSTPAAATATAAKPIPLAKPGSTFEPDAAAWSPAAVLPPPITNALINSGQAISINNSETAPDADRSPTNRIPNPTAGLHTAPEQSPHYANALAYGHEHGYKDDEIMKLAVLMQNNGGDSNGREWLALKPDVLRAAVNAVVRNADNSFDTSGVFGGRIGYTRSVIQRMPADAATAAYQYAGDSAPQYASAPPDGWTLVEETVVSPKVS